MPKGRFPEEEELAVTSSPLMAAAFYIGDQCKKQNDDFMLCKQANNQHPEPCLKEGYRVTRCVQHIIYQLQENCRKEFTAYWQCLDNNNQEYMYCRDEEQLQNSCVQKLGWSKKLWVANGPEAGYKPPGELPAADSSQYQKFVKSNKTIPDPSSVTL
jgi:hypothetical protein